MIHGIRKLVQLCQTIQDPTTVDMLCVTTLVSQQQYGVIITGCRIRFTILKSLYDFQRDMDALNKTFS